MSEGSKAKSKDGEARGMHAVARERARRPTTSKHRNTGTNHPDPRSQFAALQAGLQATVTVDDPRLSKTAAR